MNFSRKMKAGVAALAAIATLGAGGVVTSTAFAGGGGGISILQTGQISAHITESHRLIRDEAFVLVKK